ncbi:MAG: hypothetical protein ACR2RF_18785 [Geminicoccaceae bacterium]
MTAQILEFPIIPLKPADRVAYDAGLSRFQCPECGTYRTIEHGPLFNVQVAPLQICDSWHGCGAEMRPVEK